VGRAATASVTINIKERGLGSIASYDKVAIAEKFFAMDMTRGRREERRRARRRGRCIY
jgi:hypothetical protein